MNLANFLRGLPAARVCGPHDRMRPGGAPDQVTATSLELRWTILRPGGLTDEPGTGRVRIETTPFQGWIPRADVAGVLARVLFMPQTDGRILYLSAGDRPIGDALLEALAPGL